MKCDMRTPSARNQGHAGISSPEMQRVEPPGIMLTYRMQELETLDMKDDDFESYSFYIWPNIPSSE